MGEVARFIAVLCLLAAVGSPALGADAAEISFWESVRDSRSAAELQAYLDRYPKGGFAVLARGRLAALGSGAAPQSSPPPPPPPKVAAWEMPKAGDTWTYRLREPKRVDGLTSRTVVVTVASASGVEVVDQAALDGATPPLLSTHAKGSQLLAQGVAVFSPYFPLFAGVPTVGSVGRVQIDGSACGSRHLCEAKGRIVGRETVRVPAGTFVASKIVIEQSWRATFAGSGGGAGGRTLTVWYAPEARRAVKYLSRTIVGFNPPIEPDFELELVSYKVD
ncbi:MAG: hypothetical protein QOD26_668 [Betaproteobacteria bacterium]|jgi:hypothetical protein|nr:hypothetical protein [Betaproteobacteria bacterium]